MACWPLEGRGSQGCFLGVLEVALKNAGSLRDKDYRKSRTLAPQPVSAPLEASVAKIPYALGRGNGGWADTCRSLVT